MKIEFKDLVKELFIENKFAKRLFLVGLVLLGFVYTIDKKWFIQERSNFFGWNYTNFLFYLGLFIILFALLLTLFHNLWSLIKIIYYRCKYPINKVDKKFHIISFSGTVYLFDINNKTSHWIASWQTAEDLRFQSLWTYTDEKYKKGNIVQLRSGATVDLSEYTQGNRIHTRGFPGK